MKNSYLIFDLKNEFFAIEVKNLTEAVEMQEITPVPETSEYIKGIINYRGDILPVIDMNLKFNLKENSTIEDSVILVLNFMLNDKQVKLGAIVDSVTDVLEVDFKDITSLPEIGTKYNKSYVKGVIKHKGEFVILPNLEKIFAADEISIIMEVAGEKENE
ncbi:MAG: chemotaxis protein CheW [Bacteroidota bacterium]|nr:chemotaxis protein CheW [Bacteroidota bacterium]